MYKIFAILILILTFAIAFIKPDMHKQFVVYDSNYVIEIPKEDKIVNNTKIVPEVSVKETTVKVKEEPKIQEVKKEAEKPAIKVTTTTKTAAVNNPSKTTQTKTTQIKETKKAEVKIEPKVEIKAETAKPDKTDEIKKVEIVQTTSETEEERISWNIWHSRIQNKIMDDVNMPQVPYGTIFEFQFDVDKFGRVSNIKTYSKSPQFTPYAVQYLAPLIRSYQGKEILNFPSNSQRITTTFSGMFRVSPNSKYSKPEDYNDTERVIK